MSHRGRVALRWAGVCVLALCFCPVAQAQPPVWEGYRSATTAAGSTVMIPAKGKAPLPVLVLLPFTGGTAADLLERWYARSLPPHAASRQMIVVLPAAQGSGQDYASGEAWSATLKRYSASVAADVDEIVARQGGDPRRVALAGYSMGGDLAWALMQRDRERYSGAIVMGSRATYREKGALERLAQRGFRLFWFMGDAEADVRVAGAQAAQQAARTAGIALRTASAAGAHVTAPPEIFGAAIDTVFGFQGPRPAPLAQAPAAASGHEDFGSSEDEDEDEDEDDENEQAALRGPRRLPAALDIERLMRHPASRRHPLRAAETRERPDAVGDCELEPFEDEEDFSGWGYRNERGKVVIPPRFSNADEFDESGLALVWDDNEGGPGYIDCKGRYFNVFYERSPDEFSDELVRFQDYTHDAGGERVHLIGFLNRRGEVFLPARYEFATSFCDGVARVGSGCAFDYRGVKIRQVQCAAWSYVDLQGQPVKRPKVDPECGEILVEPRADDEEALEWFGP